MVVKELPRRRSGSGRRFSLPVRLAIWSAMVAALFWTLMYQRAQRGTGIPEFVYANF